MTILKPTTEPNSIPPVPDSSVSLSDTLNSLPIGVILLDSQGFIASYNQEAARLLGALNEKLTGLRLEQFWPKTAAEIALALPGGRQAIGLVPPESEGCYVLAKPLGGTDNGTTISIFDNPAGQLNPNARRANDPLAPYYRQLLDSSSDGISIIDSQGKVVLMNEAAARQMGVSQDIIQGCPASFFVENSYTSDVISYDVLASGKPVTRLVHYFKTGKHILLTGTPIFTAMGEVGFAVINERDLTELLELQTSLQQQKVIASHFKDELAELRMAELAERELVAKSPAMQRTIETAAKLARYDFRQILLTGESGVGKGILAKFIHSKSKGAQGPFIQINCAALPEQLLEAELFGYEKGAFEGASPEGRAGVLEVASKGTVYLDEIGRMPLSVQAKLLAFLDTRFFRRIHGHGLLSSECAIVAGTDQDLRELTEANLFRSDLYFRLGVFCIPIPPLRERKDDIMELARRELTRLNQLHNRNKELDPVALGVLLNHPFPGNVRELLNSLNQAVLLSEKPHIGEFLAQLLGQHASRHAAEGPSGAGAPPKLSDNIVQTEKASLKNALGICRNTREMADLLGISQAGVSRKLKKYGLPLPKDCRKQPSTGRHDKTKANEPTNN
jgi:PAS domain S-box-containing protein